MTCDDYDDKMKIKHSHRQETVWKIYREIEPGIIKIFDFHIEKDIAKRESITNDSRKTFRILSMRDDKYLFDKTEFKESVEIQDQVDQEQSQKRTYSYYDKKSWVYTYSAMTAFSINWPYVTFTGLTNHIILINAFDKRNLRRI